MQAGTCRRHVSHRARWRRQPLFASLLAATIATVALLTASAANAQTPLGPLAYGGGLLGITGDNGVETGVQNSPERVYLVFWGSGWGNASTDSNGNIVFSCPNPGSCGDPDGAAPYVQNFLKGMGTNGETWDGIITQYCQGYYSGGVAEGVTAGATSCPSGDSSEQVGYPGGAKLGGALQGVWYDDSPLPTKTEGGGATYIPAEDIANEATSAAEHFGNTSETQQLAAQYVIMTPSRTNPDNFTTISNPQFQFCGYHGYTLYANVGLPQDQGGTANGGVPTPDGTLYYTLLPYGPDIGCGVPVSGDTDSFSEVEGHEFAETATDPMPWTGWSTCLGTGCGTLGGGSEVGDLCENDTSLYSLVSFATGSFAVQPLWSNSDNGCVQRDAIVP